MSKKILLISANQHTVPYPVYPIGLSYISTYLKDKLSDFEISIYDMNLNSIDDLKTHIKNENPNYIGVSFRNVDDVNSYNREFFINYYKDLIDEVRTVSNSKIIIGGSGYSIFPELLYKKLNPDFGIYGEGEESLYKLIIALESNGNLSHIDGLVYTNKQAKQIFIPRENYFRNLDLNFDENIIDFYWQKSGMLNIQTKRGCPFNCIYCTYPLIEGRKVRTLNPDKIVETLKKLYYQKGINYIFFTDSVFNIHNEYNIELAEKIIASKIDIKWGAYFTLTNLNEDLLRLFKKAGLSHVEFGTESISETSLKNYGKEFTVADVMEQSAICNKLDIDYAHFLILGGWGETDATVEETYANSAKMGRSVFFPYVGMRIYPGTKLQEYAIKDGVISKDDDLIQPKYYISPNVNYDTLKERAIASGKKWSFPDEDITTFLKKMRKRNKKGPLWEYLLT